MEQDKDIKDISATEPPKQRHHCLASTLNLILLALLAIAAVIYLEASQSMTERRRQTLQQQFNTTTQQLQQQLGSQEHQLTQLLQTVTKQQQQTQALQTALQQATAMRNAIPTTLNTTIAQRRAAPEINILALVQQLEALQQAVTQLPITLATATPNIGTTTITTGSRENRTASGWRYYLNNGLANLKNLVVIRQINNSPMKPEPITPSSVGHLQIKLAMAQWALLQQQPVVYRYMLEQANKETLTHFDPEIPAVKAISTRLTELAAMPIIINLPNEAGLLQTFDKPLKPLASESTTTITETLQ